MEPGWSQCGARMEPGWSQCGARMEPWGKELPRVDPGWSQGGARVEPVWSQDGARVEPVWSQGGARMEPGWSQGGARGAVPSASECAHLGSAPLSQALRRSFALRLLNLWVRWPNSVVLSSCVGVDGPKVVLFLGVHILFCAFRQVVYCACIACASAAQTDM